MTQAIEKKTRIILTVAISLVLGLAGSAEAGKGGNGKGGGGGGGGDGGAGEDTPVKITFADGLGASGYRISGDGLGAYVHDGDGTGDGTQAYLGGGGAKGDIFLRLAHAPSRGLYLDFGGCYPDSESCSEPTHMGADFAGVDYVSSISVAPGDVGIKDGLFGIAPGTSVVAPMHMYYDFENPEGPGQIHFESGLKGNHPCKNKSLDVTVARSVAGDAWTVSADLSVLACATLQGGAFSGQYQMPFVFTVELLQ